MAFYKLINGQHAELNDGTKLGFGVIDGATVNGKSLAKGQGSLHFKEVSSNGEAIQGARHEAFTYGQTITGL